MKQDKKDALAARVIPVIQKAFKSDNPEKLEYVVDRDKFSFYLYASVPKEGRPGERTNIPVAKFSFLDGTRQWQLSWMPPDGRWKKYGIYYDLDTSILIIKSDPAGTFMGEVSPLSFLKRSGKETG